MGCYTESYRAEGDIREFNMCADSWDWEGLNAFRLDVGARAASPHQQRLEQQQRIQNARAAKPSNFRQESHYKSNQGQFSSNSNGVSFCLAVHGTLIYRTFMEAFEIDNSAKRGTLTQLPCSACHLLTLVTDAGKAHLSRSSLTVRHIVSTVPDMAVKCIELWLRQHYQQCLKMLW